MNREDYFKYYIQGSDHYLIPKDVFIELFEEMSNWREEAKELKEKYLNAVSDYETTMFEKEQLNSLVNSCQEEIRRLKKQLTTYQILHRDCKVDNLKNISKIEEMENQQKEFINYLEDEIKRINPKELDIGELNLRLNDIKFTQYLIYKEILQKCKEIIGVKDER